MAKLNLPTAVTAAKLALPTASSEWRCLECGKLLGIRRGAKLHVRMHGHDYQVSLPAEAICRCCGSHNQT